MSKQLYNTG